MWERGAGGTGCWRGGRRWRPGCRGRSMQGRLDHVSNSGESSPPPIASSWATKRAYLIAVSCAANCCPGGGTVPPYAPGMLPPPYAPAFMHELACPKAGEAVRPAKREGAGCMRRRACMVILSTRVCSVHAVSKPLDVPLHLYIDCECEHCMAPPWPSALNTVKGAGWSCAT